MRLFFLSNVLSSHEQSMKDEEARVRQNLFDELVEIKRTSTEQAVNLTVFDFVKYFIFVCLYFRFYFGFRQNLLCFNPFLLPCRLVNVLLNSKIFLHRLNEILWSPN